MIAVLRKSLSFIPLSLLCFALKPDALNLTPPPGRMNALPARTLWVWERREDLRTVDPDTTAIATLDSTIVLGRTAALIMRRQPYIYPAGIRRIAVVRIETAGPIAPALEKPTADLILESAGLESVGTDSVGTESAGMDSVGAKSVGGESVGGESAGIGSVGGRGIAARGIAALQIDFDARRSEREFYASLLHDLRRRMPPELPLSMTALASWCSSDDWIGGLPVDEAVPMFFRMEPDRRYAPADLPQFHIREPLCMGSIGISTHEQRAVSLAGKRVYIFPDRGWREDLPLVTEDKLNQRTMR
jgi:Protein of unknown function (DUF3142)